MVCAGSGEWEAASSLGDGVLRAACSLSGPRSLLELGPEGDR